MDLLLTVLTHPLVSLVLGGLITLYVSRRYYQKASKDLNDAMGGLHEESKKLRDRNDLIFRALREFSQSGNVIEYNEDPETGEPIGLHIKRAIGVTAKSNVSLDKQVTRAGGGPPPGGRWSRLAQSARSIVGTAWAILRSFW